MTLNEAQNIIDEWINKFGVRYFNELTNMALLTEEVGELADSFSAYKKVHKQAAKDRFNVLELREQAE